MRATSQDFEAECTNTLNRFFVGYPDGALRERSFKVLRLLLALGEPMLGNPAAWAAGIVYALSNRYRPAFGIPGLLNQNVERIFGIKMESIRTRGKQINSRLDKITDF